MVVVVEAHSPLPCHRAHHVEHLAAAKQVITIAKREEFDIASELGVAKFGLVVERPRQNVEFQRIDMAPNNGEPQFGQSGPEVGS